jgi:hypothetical protein
MDSTLHHGDEIGCFGQAHFLQDIVAVDATVSESRQSAPHSRPTGHNDDGRCRNTDASGQLERGRTSQVDEGNAARVSPRLDPQLSN